MREEGTIDELRAQHFPEGTQCTHLGGGKSNTLTLEYFSGLFGLLILVHVLALIAYVAKAGVTALASRGAARYHWAAGRDCSMVGMYKQQTSTRAWLWTAVRSLCQQEEQEGSKPTNPTQPEPEPEPEWKRERRRSADASHRALAGPEPELRQLLQEALRVLGEEERPPTARARARAEKRLRRASTPATLQGGRARPPSAAETRRRLGLGSTAGSAEKRPPRAPREP